MNTIHIPVGEGEMSTNVVNLDALIPREDFGVDERLSQVTPIDRISITSLWDAFFASALRKPDFQRETARWTPDKVSDLIRAFVDADLIPAVILWRAGNYVFVIDGAHRLSALLAWIYDDYGDRQRSMEYFGQHITEDQKKVAKRTRELVDSTIGSYQSYRAWMNNQHGASETIKKRLANLSVNSIIAQWVPSTDAAAAEASFFKINQAATPVDATESRILSARKSASAIASRAITHAGTGHKYWSSFSLDVQNEIESTGKTIYAALYEPPITGTPITTLDLPLAGRGYNVLPFVFDLVNESSGVAIPDTTKKKQIKEELPPDLDGHLTITYLKSVKKVIARLTGDNPSSLGIHPVVYFYSRTGAFQPIAFFATSRFFESLAAQNSLSEFTRVRSQFEDYQIGNKEALSLIIHKFGTGGRSIPWVQKYYELILTGLLDRKSVETIKLELANNHDFSFLGVQRPPGLGRNASKATQSFSASTKTATFLATALSGCARCSICDARIHKNSINFDHKERVRDGGSGDMRNAQVTHPYCNSTIKN